jgi:hypothetical protein
MATPCNNSIANATGHGGGTVWPSGSAGFNAATAWINGGLVARNNTPPPFWLGHQPAAVIATVLRPILPSRPGVFPTPPSGAPAR